MDGADVEMTVGEMKRRMKRLAMECAPGSSDAVDHPAWYGGAADPYEAIKVIEAWGLGFCLGNTVKYIARAGRKDPAKEVEDLEKARFYLDRRIAQLRTHDERCLCTIIPMSQEEMQYERPRRTHGQGHEGR